MAKLNSKERVNRALNFMETDRVPIDMGAGISSNITIGAYKNLKKFLGIDSPTEILEKTFGIANVEESVFIKLDTDFRRVNGHALPDGYFPDPNTFIDEWGVKFIRPEGGEYFDSISAPLKDADVEDLEKYPWPDPEKTEILSGLEKLAKDAAESPFASIGSPFPFSRVFEQAHFLRGFQQFLIDLMSEKEFAHALLRKIVDVQKKRWGLYLRETGKYVDVVRVGDDVAMQSGPLMSPGVYREMVKPYHKELFQFIKEHTDAKLLYHCCGDVTKLIDDFIEIGVDILNPVQVSASNMDTKILKEKYHGKIVFWGAVDSQKVLPSGTEDDVRAEVRKRIDDLAEGGGFVLSAVHNIQSDVPPENIVAMIDEAHRYTGIRAE